MFSRQVLFLGDCQAEMLALTYHELVAPLNDERVTFISNINKKKVVAAVQSLQDRDTVVVQVFDTLQLVSADELPSGIKTIEFPSIFLGCLWPYCRRGHIRNTQEPSVSSGPFPAQLGDAFLDRLILEETKTDDALSRYLDLDIARTAHLDRLLELHIENQAMRDQKTDFAIATAMEAKFRDEALFLTPSHPTMPLWLPLLKGVFERLEVPRQVTERALQSQHMLPFPKEGLPIHPGVISHFGLKFVTESSRYPWWNGASISFSEFVVQYMEFFPTSEHSPEAFVQSLYRLLVDREPDSAGFAFYVSALKAGMTFQALLKIFLESKEFTNKNPGFQS